MQLAAIMTVVALLAVACGAAATPTPTTSPTATPVPSPAATATVAAPTPTPAAIATPTATSPAAPAPTPTASATPLPAPTTVTANIQNIQHVDLTIQVGTTVVWKQREENFHTTTSGRPDNPTGIWDSPILEQGGSFSRTFTEVGTFPYFCKIHPSSMQATITVVEALGAPTPAVPVVPTATPVPTPTTAAPAPTPTPMPIPADTPIPTPTTLLPGSAPTAEPTVAPSPTPTPTLTPVPTPPPAADPTPTPARGAITFPTDIQNFKLQNLTIQVGDTVKWTQKDDTIHTTTSGQPGNPTPGWDSPNLRQGENFINTFDKVGTFPYFCRIHGSLMTATITVVPSLSAQSASASTPTSGPPPDSGIGY